MLMLQRRLSVALSAQAWLFPIEGTIEDQKTNVIKKTTNEAPRLKRKFVFPTSARDVQKRALLQVRPWAFRPWVLHVR